jgi:hypothetical protein
MTIFNLENRVAFITGAAFIHIRRRSISRLSAVCRLMAQPPWQEPGHRRTSSEVGEEYGISQAY